MEKIRCENLNSKSKLNNLLSCIVNVEKELESLKTDLNDINSEHKKSKNSLYSIKNTFDLYRKESLRVSHNLISLSDETSLARNEIYYYKRENHIVKNNTLIVINGYNVLKSMIRKDVRSVKSITNKLYNARKDIDTFKVSFQIC